MSLKLDSNPGPTLKSKPGVVLKARDRRRLRRAAQRQAKCSHSNENEFNSVGEEPNDNAQVDAENETVSNCNVTEEVVQLSSEEENGTKVNDAALCVLESKASDIVTLDSSDTGITEEVDICGRTCHVNETEECKVPQINVPVVQDSDANTNVLNADVMKGNAVKVYACVEFTSLEPLLGNADVESVDSILKSREHLRRNISYVTYGALQTFKQHSGEFIHCLSITMDVDTSRLWEGARSYVFHHLGKDSWTIGNGTKTRFSRIHQKKS